MKIFHTESFLRMIGTRTNFSPIKFKVKQWSFVFGSTKVTNGKEQGPNSQKQ